MSGVTDLAAARWLTSPSGRESLEALREIGRDAARAGTASAVEAARRVGGTPARAAALLDLWACRRRAVSKFERADSMYFTREALEQATSEIVSVHHAERFRGASRILDAGCSIGGDLTALARVAPTIGVERDPVRALFARANVATTQGANAAIAVADVRDVRLACDAMFCDPARRDDRTRRILDPEQSRPPLSWIANAARYVPRIGAKLAPAFDGNDTTADAELEYVSVRGECREALAWFGDARTAARRATRLPKGGTFFGDAADCARAPQVAMKAGSMLFDPDAALVRSGLLASFAERHGLAFLDARIAYLTGDDAPDSRFVRGFRIVEHFPFQLKQLRRRLRELGIGSVEIKKRGFPMTPEELRGKLDLRGDDTCTIVLARVGEQRIAYITRAIDDTLRAPSRA